MKQKLLCLLLILAVVFTLPLSVQAAVEPTPIHMSFYTFGVNPEEKTIHLSLQLENNTAKALSCQLYTVVENQNGIADSCHTTSVTVNPKTNRISVVHPYTAEGEHKTLKVYCWNGAMQALAAPLQKALSFEGTVYALTVTPKAPILYLSEKTKVQLQVAHAPASAPAQTLEFASQTPNVVTVSSTGEITPVATGRGIVQVVNAQKTAYGQCEVLVVSQPTKLQLNKTEVTLENGKEFALLPQITPEDAPNKQVLFTSHDTKIATVLENGIVKAVGVGTTTITATMADSSSTATCKVTVYPQVSSITLNQKSVTMWDYGNYFLTAKVKGGNGTQKVLWKSSNTAVATVSDSGVVWGVDKGETTITAYIGKVTATCKVTVHRERDYIGSVAAHFESHDNPGSISGSGTNKSYGCFQLNAGSGVPQAFYNWLISSGTNPTIGNTLKAAHKKDGGKKTSYGSNFDKAWKELATSQKEEFRSCQIAHCMDRYYHPLVEKLASKQKFYADDYSLALKAALLSRSVQHGVDGAYNRIVQAFKDLGGFKGKTDKQIITAIYKECGKVVTSPPYSDSVPMNKNSSIAVENNLVGKYLKYYSTCSSSVQAGVWKRLNVTEPKMLYDMLDNPPVVITPQK